VGGLDPVTLNRCAPTVQDNASVAPRRRRFRGDRGDVIESIVVLPVLLIMMLLVVQAGLAFHARQVMSTAAQDGAATAAASDSSVGEGLALTDQLVNGAVGALVTNYSSSAGSNGAEVTVVATANATKVFPLFPTLTLAVSASATIEQFEAQN